LIFTKIKNYLIFPELMTKKSGISKSGKSGKKTQEIRNQESENQEPVTSLVDILVESVKIIK
jgi:hypothetical protein